MTNRFIIEDAKDLYLLQEAFKLGKNVTTNTLIYDAVIESEDMTIIQYYYEMFKEDPTWASYTTNNQKISAINSTYFTRLQEGYYLVSQNFAYLDKDNTMPFTGIGNATTPFNGVMCGSNNNQYSTISLIIQTVQKAGTNYYGLFGYLDNNAVVRNLKIQTSIGISQSASASQSSVYAGGLAGYNNGAFLYNLDVTARNSIDLNANANSTIYAGSIAGYMTGGIEGYTNIIENGYKIAQDNIDEVINNIYLIINSNTKTTAQEHTATPKRLTPKYASNTPATSAAIPDQMLFVASIIAGKVITAKVT